MGNAQNCKRKHAQNLSYKTDYNFFWGKNCKKNSLNVKQSLAIKQNF